MYGIQNGDFVVMLKIEREMGVGGCSSMSQSSAGSLCFLW